MVRVVDLPTEVSGNLTSNSNFVIVSGVSVGTYGTARVALGELSSFYNNVGALNDSGVTALVDSAYIFNIINSSPAGSVTNAAPAFSSITSTPTSRDGYGILDVPRFSDISVIQSAPSGSIGNLSYSGTGVFTYVPPSVIESTGELVEGTNLYYTTSRADSDAKNAIGATGSLSYDNSTGIMSFTMPPQTTTAITEGTNLYYTTSRADSDAKNAISATGSLSYNSGTGVISFTQGNTDTVSEGSTNLYYTTSRADSDAKNAISATGSLSYDNSTGIMSFTMPAQTTTAITEGTNLYFTGGRVAAIIDSDYIIERSPPGIDSATMIGSLTDPKYLRSDISDNGVSLSLSSTLHADGAITSDGDITAFNSASDRKLKENIEVIDNAIDKVMTLSGYTFNYIGREEKMSGVMADEVESVLPEVVYEFDGEYKAVRYGNMMGLIIEAIKDLKSDINELKEKIN